MSSIAYLNEELELEVQDWKDLSITDRQQLREWARSEMEARGIDISDKA